MLHWVMPAVDPLTDHYTLAAAAAEGGMASESSAECD
jgi:hypothetical protein